MHTSPSQTTPTLPAAATKRRLRPRHGALPALFFLMASTACAGGPEAGRMQPAGEGLMMAQEGQALVVQAEMHLAVDAPAESVPAVRAAVVELGGVVQSSRVDGDDRIDLSLRVPAASLDALLAELRPLGKVDREVQSTRDVTDQLADMDARLRNLTEVRDRLRGYLEQASDLSEIVAVEAELTRVQSELDVLTARLERLQGQAAMSTLNLRLTRKRTLGPLGAIVYGIAWTIEKLVFIR